MHGLEAEYFGKINFIYLDVDDPATQIYREQFRFIYQPQLVLLDGNGEVVEQWIGPQPREEFVRAFEEILSE